MHRIHEDITLGRRLRTTDVGEFAVHEVRYEAGRRMLAHAHERANLTFIFGGAIEETALGESRFLRACDAVIKPAGTMHSNRCGPQGARSVVIEFPESPIPSFSTAAGASYRALCGVEVARAGVRMARLLRGCSPQAQEDLREMIIEVLALTEEDPAEARESRLRWLSEARSLLHAEFARPLRVHELAAALQLHPVYVARVFRTRYRCTITAYRRRLQVLEAARRLTGGEELASVALRSGFADQSHLSRAFRAAFGVSPGEYRSLTRGA